MTLKTPGDPQLTYDELATWNATQAYWTKLDAIQSHPYDQALLGAPSFGAYPFAGLLKPAAEGTAEQPVMHHYGSWPVPDEKLYLAYYEIDTNGNFDFEITDAGLERYKRMDDRSDDKIVRQDGYAFLSTSKIAEPQVAYPYSAAETRSASCTLYMPDGKTPLQISIGTSPTQYFIYLLPYEAVQTPYATADFYQQITANGQTFWYSPHFAKGAVNSENKPASVPQYASVRSARQLGALGAHKPYWDIKNITYSQELDIDYKAYEPAYSVEQPCIGSYQNTFQARYTGNQHAIKNFNSMSTEMYFGSNYSGLFGVTANGASLTDINIYPTSISSASYSGTLVGYNGGSITNCNVILESTLNVQSSTVGGFVGLNYGQITNSSVRGNNIQLSSISSISGFAGDNLGGGKISNCFVSPISNSYKAFSLQSYEAYGFTSHNEGEIESCYAVVSVSADATASGFVGRNNIYNNSKAFIRNSYSNCIVSSKSGNASGYVAANDGTIESCYSLLTVSAPSGIASGFSQSGTGRYQNCYSAAASSGKSSYGFSPQNDSATAANCFYLMADGLFPGAGQALSYPQLSQLGGSLPGFVAPASGPGSTPFSSALQADGYPFPMLPGLHHYGDWPEEEKQGPPSELPTKDNIIGVFHYSKNADGSYHVTAAALELDISGSQLSQMKQTTIKEKVPAFYSSDVAFTKWDDGDLNTLTSGYGAFCSRRQDGVISLLSSFKWVQDNDQLRAPLATIIDHNNIDFTPLYYFGPSYLASPLDQQVTLDFAPYASTNRWSATFTYDEGTDSFTIESKDK